jgi:hypothetical protein
MPSLAQGTIGKPQRLASYSPKGTVNLTDRSLRVGPAILESRPASPNPGIALRFATRQGRFNIQVDQPAIPLPVSSFEPLGCFASVPAGREPTRCRAHRCISCATADNSLSTRASIPLDLRPRAPAKCHHQFCRNTPPSCRAVASSKRRYSRTPGARVSWAHDGGRSQPRRAMIACRGSRHPGSAKPNVEPDLVEIDLDRALGLRQ